MSGTNSFPYQEPTADPLPANGDATDNVLDAAGNVPLERLGVGGMGEVFRFGDEALQRDLAIKILKAELRGNADAEERFLREARLTGSLQHPGIVPIHNLSRLADGRPCYTMKLVRGRTFADMLREEPQGPERLPRLLAILEKVCQAVAYAHSKHVIHRDLKPSNVMVGEFGEVQVMDWGLAKELNVGEPTPPSEATENVETAAWTQEGEGLSRAGSALGTPAYMPPEQAAGDWDIVDERADVFALGAILCEMLTGYPPYHGANRDELLRRARRGDVAEALIRLEKCGADAELVNLCRECSAAERLQRPRHAGVVAERLAAYQAEVRERLRQAELQRARAEVKALEERKRRRLLAALTLSALLLLAGGVAVWWQWQQRRAKADGVVQEALGQARSLREQAQADPLSAAPYEKALSAAGKAADMARAGGASETMQRQADDLFAAIRREAEQAAKDRRLLARLLEAHGPREKPKYSRSDKGTMMALTEPTTEEQFAAAFRDWGLDVDTVPLTEAVGQLKARPAAVVTEIIAGLDEWTSQRRTDNKPKAPWHRVADLAAALDNDAGSLRRELREIMSKGQLPKERALAMLSAVLRPVPMPMAMPLGKDHARLRQLAERIDAAKEPVLGLLTLTRALREAGEETLAERLLHTALTAHPREVVLYHTLGQLLEEQQPPRWSAAVECYAAARALRPDLGLALSWTLWRSGREREALDLVAWMVSESRDNPYLHVIQGIAFRNKGDLDGAIACYKEAIRLDPKDATTHGTLGFLLSKKGDVDGAIACYKKAIELDSKEAAYHNGLGSILCDDKGDYNGAIACFHKAIELDPKDADARTNLGVALSNKGDIDGAIASYRKVIELDPKNATAHDYLGNALTNKGDLDGAITYYKKAIKLKPKDDEARNNFGNALRYKGDIDGAIACYKKAVELNPKNGIARRNLGKTLRDKGDVDGAIACYKKAIELDPKDANAHNNLGAILCDVKDDYDGAIACFQKAVELDPKDAIARTNLGNGLRAKGDVEGAIACYKKAIELDPKDGKPHYDLGLELRKKGDLEGAIACYKKAIELNLKDARVYRQLGLALNDKGDVEGAIASFHKAIALNPKDANAHLSLGACLCDDKRDYDGAVACFQKAIELDPTVADPHCSLGRILEQQGRFAEAVVSLRRGHELGSKRPGWRHPSAQWLRNAERKAALADKLPAIPTGEVLPANRGEAIVLAQMCQYPYKKCFAAAARLYADALAEPKSADVLYAQHRYNAACSAALAAAGQGEDARLLPDKVKAMLRRWALQWLRDDLTAYAKHAGQNKPDDNKAMQKQLDHWRGDPDLASLRDPQALNRLPDGERAAWKSLWRDVDRLAAQRAKKADGRLRR